MAYPISCNECRRRKIKCDKVEPCGNCKRKGISCSYPSKFRSIDVDKIKDSVEPGQTSTTNTVKQYEKRIKELESKLAISEDLISIFDTAGGTDYMKYFGANSINGLEYSMMAGILTFDDNASKMTDFNHQKKDLPVLIDDNPKENMKMIKQLVSEFFNPYQFSYFNDIISKDEVNKFLDDYESITYWEHDEDIMILIVILIDTLKNCLNYRAQKPLLNNQIHKLKSLISYYNQISKTQQHDSLNLIKTQILLMNYYYYAFDFTRAWKLLFQVISNSYSIGLHISQGLIWMKINVLESIFCGVTSRPNILFSGLMRRDSVDEFGEFEFTDLLRLKNKIHVDAYIQKRSVSYADIRELDFKFDAFAGFLEQKRATIRNRIDKAEGDSTKDKLDLEKIYFLLLMSLSFQLNLHHEFFEAECESDKKTADLLQRYCDTLENSVKPNELHRIRDKLAALECLTYQFFLIFLKYLNFKSVRAILASNGGTKLKEELSKLSVTQESINKIFVESPLYGNSRVLKVIEVIRSLKIDELNTLNIVRTKLAPVITEEESDNSTCPANSIVNSISDKSTPASVYPGTPDDLNMISESDLSNCYTSEDMRSILENPFVVDGLRDITRLPPISFDDFIAPTPE